jgi:hypothetical protein
MLKHRHLPAESQRYEAPAVCRHPDTRGLRSMFRVKSMPWWWTIVIE